MLDTAESSSDVYIYICMNIICFIFPCILTKCYILIFIGYTWNFSATVDMLDTSESSSDLIENKNEMKNEKTVHLNLKILKEILNFLIFSKNNFDHENFEKENLENEKKFQDIYITLLDIFTGNYYFTEPVITNNSTHISQPSLPLSIETSSLATLSHIEKYLWSVLNSNFPLENVICPNKADTAQLLRHYR